MQAGDPLVRATRLRMAFGGVEVVKGVDIDLRAGEVHAIVGENGAGKSTLAKIIAGVHRPTSGALEAFGAAVAIRNPRHAVELGIALIHQEPLTFPDLDVAENIFVGHQPTHRGAVNWKTMHSEAARLLEQLGVPLQTHDRVRGLSVADQQMVELAAALSHDAKVLLMDETTASLTPKEVGDLFRIVRQLRSQGCAIAFVSHHLDEVMEIADRITVMRDGERVAELVPASTSTEEMVRWMVGRDVTSETPSKTIDFGEAALQLDSVTGPRISNISLSVRQGEIVGLGGLVGAGRTDVLNAIFGITPTTGTIRIRGQVARIHNPRQAMAHGIALVPEDRQHDGLLLPMSITDNCTLPSLRSWSRLGWRSPRKERQQTADITRQLQVAFHDLHQPIQTLSGGNQQKVVLGKWLLTNPKILLLDEPTRGVDVGAKDEVHRQIRALAAAGMAILLVSSDLPELLALSDRVIVMRNGAIADEIPHAEATPERVMFAATGQEAA